MINGGVKLGTAIIGPTLLLASADPFWRQSPRNPEARPSR